MAICASAVRRWLIEHDELPDEPLVTQVPVSVRSEEQMGTYGNRILLMGAPLHTDEADPVQRLFLIHDAMKDVKERHRAIPAELLQDANHFIPPAVFSRAARLTFRLSTSRPGRPNWNLVISNVPGPQFPLYLGGARAPGELPGVSVITDGMGLNITVMSYRGHLDFGILADRDQMPDVWKLIGWLREGLEELDARVSLLWRVLPKVMAGHTLLYRTTRGVHRPPRPGRAADAAARPRRGEERDEAHVAAGLHRATATTSSSSRRRAATRSTPPGFTTCSAHPDTTVQVGGSKRDGPRARRDERGARASCGRGSSRPTAASRTYQRKTDREIPLVILSRR